MITCDFYYTLNVHVRVQWVPCMGTAPYRYEYGSVFDSEIYYYSIAWF